MRDLEKLTQTTAGYKTRRGAEKRFQYVNGVDFLGFVLTRADGTFVPIAILNEKTMHLAAPMARVGIYVFNG